MYKDIKQFMEKHGHKYDGPPIRLLPHEAHFRIVLMKEELQEYVDSCKDCNKEEQFDALIDLCYVVLGTAYAQGFDFEEGWRRVHAANMKKVRATNASQSKRGSSADIIKPDGWKAPDLSDLCGKSLGQYTEEL